VDAMQGNAMQWEGVLRRGFKSNLVGNLRSRQGRDFCGVDITESTNKLAHETGETRDKTTRIPQILRIVVVLRNLYTDSRDPSFWRGARV
jgi:hypothetical protein